MGYHDTEIDGQVTADGGATDGFSFAVASGPSDGTVTMNDDGSFAYFPDTGFYGDDSFTFNVTDVYTNETSDYPGTVTLTVGESAPVAPDFEYSIYHDTSLNVAAPGVWDGVYDAESDALTLSLDSSPTHAESFDLNQDGSFAYLPVVHYMGDDSFTYKVSDGLLDSVGTVTIHVTDAAPDAEPDGIDSAGNYLYQVGWNETAQDGNQLIVQGGTDQMADPPPIQANDSDPDGPDTYNLQSILDAGPAHGTIAPISNPNATGSIDPNGGFIYTPDPGFGGIDTFTYHDTDGLLNSMTVAVSILVQEQNLEMWDGGDWNDPAMVPNEVPFDKELTRGAFTVYNNNDTNGDVMVDSLQSPVAATNDGRAEVDLMKIVVNPPFPVLQDSDSVLLSLTPGLDLWRDSSKATPYPHSGDPSTGENTTIDVMNLPMTLWVEATVRSDSLRDMGVQVQYGVGMDLVHVTSIWATSSAITYDYTAQQVFNATDMDPNTDPGPLVTKYKGTGIIPIVNDAYDGTVGVTNGIVVVFSIQPAIPFDSQETWEGDGVMFDAARKLQSGDWVQFNPGDPYQPIGNGVTWPTFSEASNDDPPPNPGGPDDESPYVEEFSDGSNLFFSQDSPGYPANFPPVGTMPNERIGQWEAWEFLRVSFNGNRPEGGTPDAPVTQGSRVSDYLPWYSQISVTSTTVMVNGQPIVLWTRNGAPHANVVAVGDGFTHLGPPFDS